MDRKFHKLITKNNWESETFFIQDRQIKNGDRLDVKMPNGRVLKATAKVTKGRASYSDWGHTYETDTEVLTVVMDDTYFGLKMEFTDYQLRNTPMRFHE